MSDPTPPQHDDATETIPVAQERLKVSKHETERLVATIRLRTHQEEVPVRETLRREHVDIERLPVDRIVDEPPATREEGDVTIIPIVEEVLVRRFRVVEELHVRRRSDTVKVEETVMLRRQDVQIDTASAGRETPASSAGRETPASPEPGPLGHDDEVPT
ncbi:YsnF/AvaK domain-containing protein [uncultured Jannaschia sp.]|uniref:YsnF/AvaK domain-containing protein n=1 Tax=uncultured Jannaschia sp. TaxID=293347 RepID=UPI00261F9285|nr:YsnF/AvaK domain-containing protein [uncultured Jannaschia sp.]